MKATWLVWGVFAVGGLAAQEAASEVAARIRAGGWLEASKYRRGADGQLELLSTYHMGGDGPGEFLPLLDAELSLANVGLFGVLSLVCHGDGDLVAMTDAAFHFGALGIDGSDIGLRQFLAVPPPSFDGPRGRAELLDRLLAIDRLERRGVVGAVAELKGIAGNAALPAVLRGRAERAMRTLQGGTAAAGPQRARLDAAVVALPAAFDACLVVDHTRLPDLRWLAPLGRRTGALATAAALVDAGGTVSPAMCNGAQRMCDMPAEAPFWFALRYGNLQVDHSVVTISMKGDARAPVALTWNAVGAFEAEGWQSFALPEDVVRDKGFTKATGRLTASTFYASTDGSKGKPRPELCDKLTLLRDDGSALRIVLPANSKLWPALAFLDTPPTEGGEIRFVFGDPAVITFAVDGRDEDAAAAWVAKGKELIEQGDAVFAMAAEPIAATRAFQLLRQAWGAAAFSTKDRAAFAVVTVKGFTPQHIAELAEAAASLGF